MPEILLINPPVSLEERYGKLAPFGNTLPNLGLAYMAAFVREQGVDVEIFDAAALEFSVEKAARYAADKLPLLAGVTATTSSLDNAMALCSKIKQYAPDTNIVVGGAHITSMPERTFEKYRSIDYGVIGEGEHTLYELYGCINRNIVPEPVKGLIFRHKGDIIKTEPRPYIENLDSLPLPAWDLLPDLPTHYRPSPQSTPRLPSTILVSSRGCPYRCGFCDRSVYGNKYRSHSPERIFEMIEHLYRNYGIVDFAFHDEMFLLREKHVVQVCQHIMRSGFDLSWSCQGRGDTPVTDFGLRKMREAGCWQLQFGVESGSNDMLNQMSKDVTIRQMAETIARSADLGFSTKGFIMLGFPGETEDTLAETEEFILKARLDDVMIGFFTPFPGAEASRDVENYGRIIEGSHRWSDHFVSFVPETLTEKALYTARNRMYRKFYLRPHIIKSHAARLKDTSGRMGMAKTFMKFIKATR
jgi:radical SAM superfamily enzyme YgiQ (UPF0313 family)